MKKRVLKEKVDNALTIIILCLAFISYGCVEADNMILAYVLIATMTILTIISLKYGREK